MRSRLGDEHPFAVVVGAQQVVLGKVLRRRAEDQPEALVRDLLTEGPTTVRASAGPEGLLERMRHAGTHSVLVTTKEGRLLGVLTTQRLAAWLDRAHGHDGP